MSLIKKKRQRAEDKAEGGKSNDGSTLRGKEGMVGLQGGKGQKQGSSLPKTEGRKKREKREGNTPFLMREKKSRHERDYMRFVSIDAALGGGKKRRVHIFRDDGKKKKRKYLPRQKGDHQKSSSRGGKRTPRHKQREKKSFPS